MPIDISALVPPRRGPSAAVWRITNALIVVLHIPEGNALAELLAPGRARSNAEAIAYWVDDQLRDPSDALAIDCLPHLLPRLERTLHSLLETTP